MAAPTPTRAFNAPALAVPLTGAPPAQTPPPCDSTRSAWSGTVQPFESERYGPFLQEIVVRRCCDALFRAADMYYYQPPRFCKQILHYGN
jgi:hypothetical protein